MFGFGLSRALSLQGYQLGALGSAPIGCRSLVSPRDEVLAKRGNDVTLICGCGKSGGCLWSLVGGLTFHREMKDTAPNRRPADWVQEESLFMLWSAFVPFTRRTPGFSAGFSLVLVGVGVADLDLSSLPPFFLCFLLTFRFLCLFRFLHFPFFLLCSCAAFVRILRGWYAGWSLTLT